ncbi:uncharacterized protein LOC108603151 [Drosophila busckii]|uniref:uncharacterized protein LOC108603151 n=1 Tax=Drosophila busckii TaxID=30019 RepID=UPI00083EC9D1|nr:uncharacterized protein LOC108603151 [Drosophila busckii]
MASNPLSRKPSNAIHTRLCHKSPKMEMPVQLTRNYERTNMSGKESHREREREKKLKLPSSHKQSGKRLELMESLRAQPKLMPSERQLANAGKYLEQAQSSKQQARKLKAELLKEKSAVAVATATTAAAATESKPKPSKEYKALEKAEPAPRPVRTKQQIAHTKLFFDKYLKFAYDLSTPEGVRKLEAHFFPGEQLKSQRRSKDAAAATDKQADVVEQYLQQTLK